MSRLRECDCRAIPASTGWRALGLLVLLAAACGRNQGPRDIPETRRVQTGTAGVARAVDSAQRFGYEARDAANTPASGGLAWDLPAGWSELPPTPLRIANFAVAPEVECYLTVLPGGGGGLAANLNRWRRQMSLPPHTDAEIAALSKRTVLGAEARYVEYEGTYSGMDGVAPRPHSLLVGVAFEHDGQGMFIKMVGPAGTVRGQIAAFEALCASLRARAGSEAAPPVVAGGEIDAGGGSDFGWATPPGWTRGPASPMRIVTFKIGRATECYVTVLDGAGGGLGANINRWRDQMGQPPLDAGAVAALPAIPMLGGTGRWVQIRGDFTGMDGATRDRFMLLGAVCERGGRTVFVKMTGPETEVRQETSRFEAFCRSLH
jgi:hypothetical protein